MPTSCAELLLEEKTMTHEKPMLCLTCRRTDCPLDDRRAISCVMYVEVIHG